MRILTHDYPGHPFPIQLSKELACRGHQLLHLHAGYNVTPRGELLKRESDPDRFSIQPVYICEPLKKYHFVKRWFQEREYGQLLVDEIKNFCPDIIISSQTPLDAQIQLQIAAQKNNVRFIFWLQDVIGLASQRLLRKKLSIIGDLIGRYYIQLERRLLRKSDHIVLITEDFQPLMNQWGVDDEKTSVIPNWAPLESVSVQPKQNPWAQQYDLADKFCFMYTGTLGMKHNPDVLLQLALHYQDQNDVFVVVISEGPGADWLAEKKFEHKVENLILLPFQPFEQLPQVMAAADVLVALLEPDAGVFSVPSKVLTYLCAQRPLLLAVPLENLAAKIVSENQAGIVVPPDDIDAFLDESERLLHNPALRDHFAHNARRYAEKHFDIQTIGDQFEEIITTIA
jgi:glycosyltransferase involved in cell wall biosynthesis